MILKSFKSSLPVTKFDSRGLSFCIFHLSGIGLFMNLQAACPDSGCTATFSANRIPTAVAILNACRERLLAGRTQTPAGITSGLGKTSPSLLVGLQLPCFSVSGVCRRCGGSSRAGEAETAGTVPWAGARTDNSCDTRGCEWGRGGVWSWSWAMSG